MSHHIAFEDYSKPESAAIGELMLSRDDYHFSADAEQAFGEYLGRRLQLPRFANARSVRNALERCRLRQANRLVAAAGPVDREDLMTLTEQEVRGSSIFASSEHPDDVTNQ